MIQLEITHLEDIQLLRKDYFNSLPAFQDLFLEFMIQEGTCYALQDNNLRVGYAIVSRDNILVELFTMEKYGDKMREAFSLILDCLGIVAVYCKSFDGPLLNCCLAYSFPSKNIGLLYRDFTEKGTYTLAPHCFRFAELYDLEFLLGQDDEVFEPRHQLVNHIESKSIILLDIGEFIVGCGFLTRVHPDFSYFDIGVWVDPDWRFKGYATQIMLYLKDCCFKNGWVPICACDISNMASQKVLEHIGFEAKHSLIAFETS
jgi:GNAT superfamily N-acetyltransferase